MAKDEDEVIEDEEGEEDDVGIFDEDLKDDSEDDSGDDLGEVLEDDLEEVLEEVLEDDLEEVSDFFIGDTILSSGAGEQSWSKEDLEEVLRNERIEKDWQDSEEFVGGDFYDAVSGNFYGADSGVAGSYEDKIRGGDLYKENGGGDLYNAGDVYSGKKNADGVYDAGKGMKSYDEIADNRHKGYSALESMRFQDKEKQEKREKRDFGKYDVRKAA